MGVLIDPILGNSFLLLTSPLEEWWVEAVPVSVIIGWSWPWMMSANQGLARDRAKHLTRQHRWCNEKVVVHSLHKHERAGAWRRTTHTEVMWHCFLFKMSLCNQKRKFCFVYYVFMHSSGFFFLKSLRVVTIFFSSEILTKGRKKTEVGGRNQAQIDINWRASTCGSDSYPHACPCHSSLLQHFIPAGRHWQRYPVRWHWGEKENRDMSES